jgi:hypothetical protein
VPVLLDVESRSRADLKRIGGRNYWAHPSTEALCVVLYDTDSDDLSVWLPGDPEPWPGRELAAHNARGFDHFAAMRLWGRPVEIDTSELARRAGLPGALDALGTRWLGLPKDKVASKFTKSLSRPSRAKKTLGQLPDITAQVLERVVAYCVSDVEIIAHGWEHLEPWLDVEPDVLRAERAVNDRGICFDVQLAKRLLECDARNAAKACEDSAHILGEGWTAERVAEVARSPVQFCEYAGAENAQAETIAALIADTDPLGVAHALASARQALASIARGKLEAGLARVSPDGRLRDSHRYYGAHTGRWSGKGMQLQNMPRPVKRFEDWGDDQICALADAVLAGKHHADQEEIDLLLRATLHAKPGHVLVTVDFSGVEARALAWAAGDHDAIGVVLSGRDPYRVAAAQIFGCSYDDIPKSDPRRQAGKVSELACLAGDTPVLTDRGVIPLLKVTTAHRVWDGESWVTHSGLVYRGQRETITVACVRMTADHAVLCGETWTPAACLVQSESTLSRALATASGGSWLKALSSERAAESRRSWCGVTAALRRTACLITTCAKGGLPAVTCALRNDPGTGINNTTATQISCPTTGTGDGCSTAYPRSSSGALTPARSSGTTTAGAASRLRPSGETTSARSLLIWSRFRAGITQIWNSIAKTITGDTGPGIFVSSPSALTGGTREASGSYSGACSSSRRVYDLANVGPRNRFTILTDQGPLIVHNCGYGGGVGALENMARASGADFAAVGVDPAEVVAAWRELHAPIVQFWYALERAFASAVRGYEASASVFTCTPADDGSGVAIFLPSGRPIVYNETRVTKRVDRYGRPRDALAFLGTKNFVEHTYGGKLTENVIQAMCRDLMAVALVKAEDAGLDPVLHVHDEIVAEVPANAADEGLEYLTAIMTDLPEWAEGFPIGAAGHVGRRYRK